MSMSIDVLTLYLLNFVIAIVMAGIYFFSWFHHRDILGVRGWATALLLGALGSLELSLRTNSSPIPLVIMANSLVVAGFATVWMSVRRFNSGERSINYAVIPTVLFFIVFTVAILRRHRRQCARRALLPRDRRSVAARGWEVFQVEDQRAAGQPDPDGAARLLLMALRHGRAPRLLPSRRPAARSRRRPSTIRRQGITLLINTICVVAHDARLPDDGQRAAAAPLRESWRAPTS